VLSAVSDDIKCLFFHLLENPLLCNRSTVAATNDSAYNMWRLNLKRARKNLDGDGHKKRLAGGK
jgi:hypothetical protein